MSDDSSSVADNEQDVEHPECGGRHREEVDGNDILRVVPQERPPGLRWRLAAAHVLGDGGLTDDDAKLQQLSVDVWRSPERVVIGHLMDERALLPGQSWSSVPFRSALPPPEHAESLAVPVNDRLGLNYGERFAPRLPDAGKHDPEEAVAFLQADSRPGALKDIELVAQSEVFQRQGLSRSKHRAEQV